MIFTNWFYNCSHFVNPRSFAKWTAVHKKTILYFQLWGFQIFIIQTVLKPFQSDKVQKSTTYFRALKNVPKITQNHSMKSNPSLFQRDFLFVFLKTIKTTRGSVYKPIFYQEEFQPFTFSTLTHLLYFQKVFIFIMAAELKFRT